MKFLISLLIILTLYACDKGIGPKEVTEPTGISGTITFLGEWQDSVRRTHIVMFQNPLNDASDFNVFNLKYVSEEIPKGSVTYDYNSTINAVLPDGSFLSAGEYAYLAVAQSATPELSLNREDWFVAGLYYIAGDSTQPGKIIITDGVVLENVNIVCDFDNLPPQPPGGR